MAQAPVFITRHAVSRFVKRHAPHMSEREAEQHLEQAAASAAHLREKTALGQHQWQIQDPECVLVMKQDGHKLICVTVLPEPEMPGVDVYDGILVARPRTPRRR